MSSKDVNSGNSSFFSIDGNIKQRFLPFLLNNDGIDKTQVFSFKYLDDIQGAGKLNICPKSIETHLTEDISFQSVFGPNGNSKFDLNTLFNSIPGLQIREFLPDTKLDQALNFFTGIFHALQSVLGKGNGSKSSESDAQAKKMQPVDLDASSLFDKITKVGLWAIKYLTGMTSPNFYNAISKEFFEQANSKLKAFNGLDSDLGKYVLSFPYTMWYLLQSSTTTNIYELPGIVEGKEMYASDGHPGWPTAGFGLAGDSGVLGSMSGSMVGKAINTLLGNVQISFMPWWNAVAGNATPFSDIKVKIDLFNDSAAAAATNFIFVNTIVPNNKWIQYNMFQHSPCIYDIKLDGYKRLYACSGRFTVTYSGVLRDINSEWFDIYLKKHINGCAMNAGEFDKMVKQNKLIKIPDVYHVDMEFKSLLPDTFNNYLYNYSSSNIVKDDVSARMQTSSALKSITNGIADFAQRLKDEWTNAGAQ